ncbi:unnamed protein product, partial [Ectocarpus sp. 8 AP-2014]
GRENGTGRRRARDNSMAAGETSETSAGCESEIGRRVLTRKPSTGAPTRTRRRGKTDEISPSSSLHGRAGHDSGASTTPPIRSSHLLKAIYHQNTLLLDQVASLETLAEHGTNNNDRAGTKELNEQGDPSRGIRRGSGDRPRSPPPESCQEGGVRAPADEGVSQATTKEPAMKSSSNSTLSVPEAVAEVAAAARRGSSEAAAGAAAAAVAAAVAVQTAVTAAGGTVDSTGAEGEVGVAQSGASNDAMLCMEKLSFLATQMNVEMARFKQTATGIDFESRTLKERNRSLADKVQAAEEELASLKAQLEAEREKNRALSSANHTLQRNFQQQQRQHQQQMQHQQQKQREQLLNLRHQQALTPPSHKQATLPAQRSYPGNLGGHTSVLSPRLTQS